MLRVSVIIEKALPCFVGAKHAQILAKAALKSYQFFNTAPPTSYQASPDQTRMETMSDSMDTTSEHAADMPVYDRLGNLVRSLHDALRQIGAEKVLTEAASEFPSARERLLHIGQLTEKAANTVLNKVDETQPIQERLVAKAKKLAAECHEANITSQVPEQVQALVGQMTAFIAETQTGCDTTRAALSEMMMAQDFQDLTGQLIKKVVTLLENTERDLLRLLIDAAPEGSISEVKKEEVMAGPGAPGGVALEQGAVDDLLADLGF